MAKAYTSNSFLGMQEHTIHISPKSLLWISFFLLAGYMLSLLWHTLLLVFIALIFSTLIDPFAKALHKRHIPRGVAVLIVYACLFGVVGVSVAALTPVVLRDMPKLFQNGTAYITTLQNHQLVQKLFGTEITSQGGLFFLPSTSVSNFSGVFSSISAVFGGLVSFFVVMVITFYLVIQEDPLRKMLQSLVSEKSLPFTLQVIDKVREKLGAWMRGQLLLSGIMGVLVFIVLTLLGVKYAAVIALLAGLLEFVPYVGPILSAFPALFFSFIEGGPVKFLVVFICLVLVQQFESHVIIPKVMQKAVGLNPVFSILSLLIGLQLGGIIGGVLAIPVATTLQVVIQEILSSKKR